jgi:hypothetical protein
MNTRRIFIVFAFIVSLAIAVAGEIWIVDAATQGVRIAGF